jgi:hypothetical protein
LAQIDNACPIYSQVGGLHWPFFGRKTPQTIVLGKIFIAMALPFDQVF